MSWNFLSATALAEAAAPPPGPSFMEVLILPLGLLVVMYFFIIRPQAKKSRQHQQLLQNLKIGEEVVTSGGIIGKIKSIADSFVTLESMNSTFKIVTSNIAGYTKKQEVKPTN